MTRKLLLRDLPRPAAGQFVGGGLRLGFSGFHREFGQRALDLLPDPAERDPEYALAALQQVDDLVAGGAGINRGAVAHQRDPGEIGEAVLAEDRHGRADLLQRDARVQKRFHDPQHEDVAETVESLSARAASGPDARLDQARPGPVVELAVSDPGRRARGLPTI